MKRLIFVAALTAATAGLSGRSQLVRADEQQASQAESEPAATVAGLRESGFAALQRRDADAAAKAADALSANFPADPVAWRLAGDLYLRGGKVAESIEQFERYIARIPEHEPELWQFGVALALDGRYDEGRKLFELHRTVNPNDVENALWHFYCVAKSNGAEKARESILPAPGDRRPPMDLLLRYYRDEVEVPVLRGVVEALPEGSPRRASAAFYLDLYLAMHADALGRRDQAIEAARRAAAAQQVNYMTDVARVYESLLRREAAP